ncbi:30S ribosomal protein S16 [Brevibacterium ravenspurgense]|uniref:30S ribosomal protein S16 n=1 Tax=Brevibacterium ravenspurgense TaxID=479117 RepID=UPI001EF2BF99|nr:30S ribosomal protein S16 [Brevibacterium ravenspurgense]MCG7300550.1 30S ribosomal protein S16 [Brevibacterium ravenspurgense]
MSFVVQQAEQSIVGTVGRPVYPHFEPPNHVALHRLPVAAARKALRRSGRHTDQVKALLKLTGDWAKFTGEGDTTNRVEGQAEKQEFEAPEAKSVIKPKEEKAEEAPAEEAAEAPAEEAPAAEEAEEA